jgi:hypothetical protein
MATLRPEFGPGLPEALAPRLRWSVRRTRRTLLALFVLLVIVQGTRIVFASGSRLTNDVIVLEPISFTLGYRDGLERVRPGAGETLRLQTPSGARTDERFSVAPLQLAPYDGDQAGVLPVLAAREIGRLRASFPTEFRYRGDGRARINELPGHQVLFQTRMGGRLYYGKRFFLLPEPKPPAQSREGVVITLLLRYSKATPSVDEVGLSGLTKGALRSFRFGAERP